MADYNEEEDLFADLYEGDDAAPSAPAPAAPAPAPATAAVEPAAAEQPVPIAASSDQPPQSEPIANGSNAPAEPQSYSNDGWNDQQQQGQQNWDYNNQNQGNDYGAPQQMSHGGGGDEDYKPIGIKEDGKMFIGGLNWETTDQSLREYFSQFGEVTECTVMRDGATGRSRGFGFLTFRDPKTVNIVMVKEHQLDGKIIDPKRAIPRDEQERTSKIFVGGVSQEATEADFKNFFMQFGRVLDATLMMDKDTGRPRGFGFVTFDSEAAVDRTLERPLEILGKYIEVKKAQPRGNLRGNDDNGNNNGGGGFKKQGFGGQQGGFDPSQQGGMQQGGPAGMGGNNMSPAMMAQYWQRMQQYFQMMQQQLATSMGGGGNPMMGGPGGMNPQMMQQMMAMQQGMGQGGMNPAMMQQMQQMQQQMQGGGGPGNSGSPAPSNNPMSPMNGGPGQRPAYNAQEQLAFEQQKYERQQQQQHGMPTGNSSNGFQPSGSPTSWEGMYDDVPAPNGGGNGGPGSNNGGFAPRGGFGGRGRGRGGGGGHTPTPAGPSNAPANAPTGPKNAGRPGANYRGGGRGGHRGFHPYSRGGGGA